MRQTNFGYILRKKAKYNPDRVAVVDSETGDEVTYGELEENSNRLAAGLTDRGIEEGDRVCGLFRNSVEFFETFFATCKLGAIMAPLNFRLAVDELQYLLDDTEPGVLIYESVFEEKVAALESAAEAYSIDIDGVQGDARSFDDLLEAPAEPPAIRGTFEDPAILLYTSGSTGRPKGVPLSHKNLFFSSVCYIVDIGLTDEDTTLTSSPLFHVGGLNIFTLPLLHVGGKVVLQREFVPEETWAIIDEHDVTKMFAIPTMVNMMINVDGWHEEHDLSTLELMAAGGEPIPTELKDAFQMIDVPLISAYGLTESTDGSLFLRPEKTMEKGPKCNGMTFTHVDAKIVDEDMEEVSTNEKGELLHRGPTVADGYWGLEEKSEDEWTNGWLHTGDIATQDEDGYFHIFGRTDDMIISGGENVYPVEVEDAIHSHPDVDEVIVFGVPNDEWGEIVKAVVVPGEDETMTKSDFREFLEGRLARFKHPKEIEFVAELPKSGTGKLERQTIIDRYGDPE